MQRLDLNHPAFAAELSLASYQGCQHVAIADRGGRGSPLEIVLESAKVQRQAQLFGPNYLSISLIVGSITAYPKASFSVHSQPALDPVVCGRPRAGQGQCPGGLYHHLQVTARKPRSSGWARRPRKIQRLRNVLLLFETCLEFSWILFG